MSIAVYVSHDSAAQFDDSWELAGTIEPRDATLNEDAAKKLRKSETGNPKLGVEFSWRVIPSPVRCRTNTSTHASESPSTC